MRRLEKCGIYSVINFYQELTRIGNTVWKGQGFIHKCFCMKRITTSDEAMTLWFLKNIEPKIKSLCENNWNETVKEKKQQGQKQGEQELTSERLHRLT